MNKKTTIGVYWNLIILGRWLITNLIIVFLRDFYVIQVWLLLIMSVAAQALMLVGKPRDNWRDNTLDFFIEVCVSLYLYVLLALTDWWGINYLRDECGWVLVILVLTVVTINFLNLSYSTIKACIKFIKKKCKKMKAQKKEAYKEKEKEPEKEEEEPPSVKEEVL